MVFEGFKRMNLMAILIAYFTAVAVVDLAVGLSFELKKSGRNVENLERAKKIVLKRRFLLTGFFLVLSTITKRDDIFFCNKAEMMRFF